MRYSRRRSTASRPAADTKRRRLGHVRRQAGAQLTRRGQLGRVSPSIDDRGGGMGTNATGIHSLPSTAVGICHAVCDGRERPVLVHPDRPRSRAIDTLATTTRSRRSGPRSDRREPRNRRGSRNSGRMAPALRHRRGTGTPSRKGWRNCAGIRVAQNARLFALLNVAMADAAIAAWDAKYFYDWWRPVTAIHNGDSDGNPATTGTRRGCRCSSHRRSPNTCPATARSAARRRSSWRGSSEPTTSRSRPGPTSCLASFASSAASPRRHARPPSAVYTVGFTTAHRTRMDWLPVGQSAEWTLSHFLRAKGNQSR